MDNLLETNPKDMLATIGNTDMAEWSDIKKAEFVKTFDARSKAAKYILVQTAEILLNTAIERHFVSQKRAAEVAEKYGPTNNMLQDTYDDQSKYYSSTVGGRATSELIAVARERADAILDELPPVRDAVAIIDKETALLMDKRDKLLAKLNRLGPRLTDYSLTIKMSEVDQKMPIGDFRAMVALRYKKYCAVARAMSEIGKEGAEIEDIINKKLYMGLPGLDDAVIKVASSHLDRAQALAQLVRRMGEKVMFGDSKEAMDILKHFEKDEVELSDDIKTRFAEALEKLKVSRKQLGKGKKR
jgi:hypothetical protein